MVQVLSQNTWPAYPDTSRFVRFTAAGEGWWAANADVAVVFAEYITKFDSLVEKIKQPVLDDWSYANRLIRGSTSAVSNHGSATAIDINSTKHPLGKVGSFNSTKVHNIHEILASITDDSGNKVLRWGGDYLGRKDEMHVEINASPARVKQAANKIRNRGKVVVASTPPDINLNQVIKIGATAARNMSAGETVWKAGDEVTLDYFIQWGGAGDVRTWKDVLKVQTALVAVSAQLGALSASVAVLATALAKNSPLTAAQIQAAAKAGAEAALAELHTPMASANPEDDA